MTSSQISAFAYNEQDQRLNIVFVKNGDEYQYSNVPKEVVDQLVAADSFGSAFSGLIKKHPTRFPYMKV
ncbi:hypothetical protein WT49_11295 [Burkholderia territorii]|nr:hypothetical protein WL19_30055 [Burkholderia ubonensis]KWE37412.1 hypothetical protein WT49_11295 [Burkholderia territorii]KWE40331.1 hypothetical protein WT51_28045 [Burkholderia territorii]